jgi:hypothetical protein
VLVTTEAPVHGVEVMFVVSSDPQRVIVVVTVLCWVPA